MQRYGTVHRDHAVANCVGPGPMLVGHVRHHGFKVVVVVAPNLILRRSRLRRRITGSDVSPARGEATVGVHAARAATVSRETIVYASNWWQLLE